MRIAIPIVKTPPLSNASDSLKPLTALRGVGPKNAERLERVGVRTVRDLLFHLPLRYEDRTRVVPIGSLRAGDQAVIEGRVEFAQIKLGRRRSLLVQLMDGTGAILLRFFHFTPAQRGNLATGARLRCFGEVRNGPASLELVHPEYRIIGGQAVQPVEETLTPVYPTTEGLHQSVWRDLTGQALSLARQDALLLPELVPEELLSPHGFPSLREALFYMHRPPPDSSINELQQGVFPARRRLVFEELLAHQLSLRLLRGQQRARSAPPLTGNGRLSRRFLDNLPYRMTGAQRRVVEEIRTDMAGTQPMLRLVQGDVGCGKTLVAVMAALTAIEAGHQVALMAPTELLAEQHFRNLSTWLVPLDIEVGYLSGRAKGAARDGQLDRLARGESGLVVGTHALFQEGVVFGSLGLVIVDEQHRFGVHQRLALHEKGNRGDAVPHQLVMTATPIPRTLAMAAYADLDLSIIDELPPGRTPVKTLALSDQRRDEVIGRVAKACQEGRQAYWVCTLIEESEALQCQAAEKTAAELAASLPGLAIGLIHGRLKAAEKEAVMSRFKAGLIHLLVATTVIEVGVDVPNASLMIIENSERLGLAQLHQLRGRVGRGAVESHCLLLYHHPLSEGARARIDVMRETNDGFRVARKDLELRGPGEVLGTRQTGLVRMRIADLTRDEGWIVAAREAADIILDRYPERAQPLVERWVGHGLDYGRV